MLSSRVEAQNPKAAGVARKVTNQFGCGHLGSQGHRGKKSPSLAPQFTSMNARSKLQLRIIRMGTNQAEKPRETEEVMASGSFREVSNSSVSSESVRMESKPCSKSATA